MTEPGVRGGHFPTEERQIDSEVARSLRSMGQESIAEDLGAFPMTVLHFRRTFVEKLFIVHGLAERLKRDGTSFGRNARHYIDLYSLAGESEVEDMLRSTEYGQIEQDYEEISLRFFKKQYERPPDLRFTNSTGIFPTADLRAQITPDYDEQCQTLCYGRYPSFDDVLARFEEIRDLL